jgi:hypothetical protein
MSSKFKTAEFTIGQKVNKDARAITVERKWNPSRNRFESIEHVGPEGVTWTVLRSEYDQNETAWKLGLQAKRQRRNS